MILCDVDWHVGQMYGGFVEQQIAVIKEVIKKPDCKGR
jgi:hypothetical protein